MIRKILSYGLAEGVARGFNWLILAVLPLILPPTTYGIVGLLVAIEALGSSVLLLGQDRSVLRYYHAERASGSFLYTVLGLSGMCAAAALLLLLAGTLGRHDPVFFGIPVFPHLVVLGLSILLLNVNRIFLSVARVEEKVATYAVHRLGQLGLKCALVLGIAWLLGSSFSYVLGTAIAVCVIVVLEIPGFLFRIEAVFDARLALKLWAFGWPFIFHVVSSNVLAFVDRFMIQYFMDTEAVGVYTLAYTIGGSVTFIYAALAVYFEPHVYKMAGNPAESEKWIGRFTVYCMMAAALAAGVILLLLPAALDFFFSPAYAYVLTLAPVVLAAHLLNPLYLQGNYRLTLYEKTKLLAVCTVIAAAVNVGSNLLLIPAFGLVGAAASTFLSYLVLGCAVFFSSVRYGKTRLSEVKAPGALVGLLLGASLLAVVERPVLRLLLLGLMIAWPVVFVIREGRVLPAEQGL